MPPPAGADPDGLPYMTHKGTLRLGELLLQAAVLSNGQRIFYGPGIEELVRYTKGLLDGERYAEVVESKVVEFTAPAQ